MGARAKEIKDKPHSKEPMTSYKRRQRHDSQLQTPRERGAVKANEEELKIKKEAVTYFGNLVPGEQGQVTISKKTHIPSPLAAKEPKKITSTVTTGKVPLLKDDLPDLRDKDVQNSAVLIQAAFRGYQTRKKKRSMADVIHSALVIQSAFRRYKARKALREKDSDLPDLKADDVVAASIKIQAAYKGFKTRKLMKKERKDDLPDLNAADVAQAALKIQSVYKGFRTRKMMRKHQEVLPGANLGEVTDATVKLQSAFRGYKARRQLKEKEDLPDLNAADVAAAAIKIQSAYKGFKARKEIREKTKVSEKQVEKKAEVAREIPKETSSYGFFGRFMSSGTKEQEQAKVVVDSMKKSEQPEKKSLFGFFGRSSSKKDVIVESNIEARKPSVEQRFT